MKNEFSVNRKLENAVMSHLTGYSMKEETYNLSVTASYIVYLLKAGKIKDIDDIDLNASESLSTLSVPDDVKDFLLSFAGKINVDTIEALSGFSSEELKNYILYAEDPELSGRANTTTPECICKLALEILNIQENDKVLDNCSGKGTFLSAAYHKEPKADYYGIELNPTFSAISKIRCSVLNGRFDLTCGNALHQDFPVEFDKVFSDSPSEIPMNRLRADPALIDGLGQEHPEFMKCTSSDWIFNDVLVKSMKETGTAVAVMTPGGLANATDRPARKLFADRKKIKAVILLPPRISPYTGASMALVVFGHSDGVIFVDATNEYENGRRFNELSDQNIEKILDAMEHDTEISKKVTFEEIKKHHDSFNPVVYVSARPKIKNGVPFGNLMKTITRGAPLQAFRLDDMISPTPTGYQYLMLSNIQNGLIDEDLPYLKSIDPEMEKYCIPDKSLLISRNGALPKIAVAEIRDGQHILANGNLFIIELDETKVNPYYVKAFLESEQGMEELHSFTVGNLMPHISINQLKTIQIPLIPMEEQNSIADRYLSLLNEIAEMRKNMQAAEEQLRRVFPKF